LYHEAFGVIYLDEFLLATRAQLHGPAIAREFADFCYDSRLVAPGQLFLALVTETGDGHDYIVEACRAGATGVVCQRPPQSLDGTTCIVVPDTQRALLEYARYVLSQREIEVIGITGSVGKTSTKEAVAAVLAQRYPVFRNEGNLNGRFGLPVALGKLRRGQHPAVLEMAADSLDEIRDLADVVRPRVAVVTRVGRSHLAYFGSIENVAREKGALVEALPPEGTAILNADDPLVMAMAGRTRARIVTFGCAPEADLYADEVTSSWDGTQLTAHWRGASQRLTIPLLGPHHAYTALAACAVGLTYGLSWDEIRAGLSGLLPLPGRTRLLEGIKGCHLLDDSYNASPTSALAALDVLAALPASRRILVLGDMAELGDYAAEGHRRVGRRAAEVVDLLVSKGEVAQTAALEAIQTGMPPSNVHITYTADDAARIVTERARAGDLILLKGSAQARLEYVTRELLRQPERAHALLPRQNRGWAQVRLEQPGRPTWVEIDLEAVAHNVRWLVDFVGPGVEVMVVLKADAYGHGAVKVARTALNNGATWLGVACLGEAIVLRRAGITAPILSLGFTPAWQARTAVLEDVTTTLFSLKVAEALARAAQDLRRPARAHVKVDTGMGRLGLFPEEAVGFLRKVSALPGLEIDGLFTHMSAADEADLGYTRQQLARFDEVLRALDAENLRPAHVHAANSACLLRIPTSHYDMVRPGIAVYGLNPSDDAPCPAGLHPAFAFKCQIAQVRQFPPGSDISYGRTFRTQRPSRIAVIPVGYADGFRRAPHHWGEVLVRGQRAPIVGRVCMDQSMIDVTDIPHVREGDEVVLIGSQGGETITVDDVARRLGTVNYEVISEILARVPRVV
jgi:alanine racemase